MKDFFKFTLATIVGILVTGAVIVGFGIISLIGICYYSIPLVA